MRRCCKPDGHKWEVTERSNIIQFDSMGYPLRLFICTCSVCGKSTQMWIDSAVGLSDHVCEWIKCYEGPIPPKKDDELKREEQMNKKSRLRKIREFMFPDSKKKIEAARKVVEQIARDMNKEDKKDEDRTE